MAEDPLGELQAALARADADYVPITSLPEWLPATLDLDTWDQAAATLGVRRADAPPPVVEAALAAIHPFADGNGRVARLLASVWLLRAASIPLWVEPTDRDRYLDALAAADRSDTSQMIRTVNEVSLRLLRELGLAIAHPVVEPASARRDVLAAEHALSRLEELLQDMEVMGWLMSATMQVGLPVDPDARPALAVAIPGRLDVRVIGALVDGSAPADARIRIVSYATSVSAPDPGGPPAKEAETQAPDLDERFALDELEPNVSAGADRRLRTIAAFMAHRWRIEAQTH